MLFLESDRGKIAIKEKEMKVLFTASGKDRLLLAPVFGEGDGTPLQYSCLENPMDGGTW